MTRIRSASPARSVVSASALTGLVAKAEADVAAGLVPPRMTTAPAVIFSKGSGITGTPTVASGGTGYVVGNTITLTGGTFLSAAILTVTAVTGGAVTGVSVLRNGVYTAVPTNPVAQGSTSGTGTGATFTVAWSVNGATTALNRVKVAAADARMRFTGVGPLTNEGASGYYGNATGNGTHSTFEWATDSQRIDLNLVGLNTNGALYVDGRQVEATPRATDATGQRFTYSLDFGTAVMRSYRWVALNQAFDGVWVDSTATVTAPLAQPRLLAWVLGDSYSGATGAENAASQHVMVMGDLLGMDVIADGVGGSGWNSASTTAPVSRVQTRLAALTRAPNIVVLDLGFNDAGGDMAALAASVDATIAAVRIAAPSARLVAFGPATPLGRTANLDLVRDAVSARCAVAGVPFVDVGDWVNAANRVVYTGADNQHPTPRGHKYLGARRAEVVRALALA